MVNVVRISTDIVLVTAEEIYDDIFQDDDDDNHVNVETSMEAVENGRTADA